MVTTGYLKDLLACILFIIIFIIVFFMENIDKYKTFFLINILFAIFADGLYSLYPSYHNTIIGYNTPSYILFFVILGFFTNVLILFIYPTLYLNK